METEYPPYTLISAQNPDIFHRAEGRPFGGFGGWSGRREQMYGIENAEKFLVPEVIENSSILHLLKDYSEYSDEIEQYLLCRPATSSTINALLCILHSVHDHNIETFKRWIIELIEKQPSYANAIFIKVEIPEIRDLCSPHLTDKHRDLLTKIFAGELFDWSGVRRLSKEEQLKYDIVSAKSSDVKFFQAVVERLEFLRAAAPSFYLTKARELYQNFIITTWYMFKVRGKSLSDELQHRAIDLYPDLLKKLPHVEWKTEVVRALTDLPLLKMIKILGLSKCVDFAELLFRALKKLDDVGIDEY